MNNLNSTTEPRLNRRQFAQAFGLAACAAWAGSRWFGKQSVDTAHNEGKRSAAFQPVAGNPPLVWMTRSVEAHGREPAWTAFMPADFQLIS